MPSFLLSKDAENDLRQIIRYTKQKWGDSQVGKYRDLIKQKLFDIGSHKVIPKLYSKNVPNVYFCKVNSHFIFYLKKEAELPVIIAILHTSQDLIKHLVER